MAEEFSEKISNQLIEFISHEFIHCDDRGKLVQLVSGNEWSQINYIKSKANAFRGGHYHKINRELFYVIDGEFILSLDLRSTILKYKMVAGDMFVISPLVYHSFHFISPTDLITMYDKGVELKDGKMDIYQ